MSIREPEVPAPPTLRAPGFGQSAEPETNLLSGPLGLRAGWGIFIFFLLSLLLGSLLFLGLFRGLDQWRRLHSGASGIHQAKPATRASQSATAQPEVGLANTLTSELAESGAVLAAAFGISFLEQRRFRVYGLDPHHLRDLVPGAACGLGAISLLVGSLWGLHLLVFDQRLLSGAAAARSGAGWLFVFALVGLFEEFLFRGYLQFTLMRGLLGVGEHLSPAHTRRAAFWMAAGLWSLLFSLTHLFNAGEDSSGIIMILLAGFVFSYALWRTGSLWWGIGFHMTWDWGQSFLFGVPDSGSLSAHRLFATHPSGNLLLSGGAAGPEGSLLVAPVLALVALVIRLHRFAAQPPVEPLSLPLAPPGGRGGSIP